MSAHACDAIRCPRCGSKNAECLRDPHRHVCHDCMYDGTKAEANR